MGFASWAGLWFGLTLPAIVLMYLFKRQYIDTKVPSHLLWDRMLRNMEANRPWQKLQNRLLLWLQLLAAALLTAALMLPFVWVRGGHAGHTVIVADTSASMSAVTGTSQGAGENMETRLDLLKISLAGYVDRMGGEEEVTLLKLGSQPEVVVSRESDRGVLKKAIAGLKVDYGTAAYRETLSLAEALTRDDRTAKLAIYTDGQWADRATSKEVGFEAPVEVISVDAEKNGNAAISQFGVRSTDGQAQVEGIAVVKNYGEGGVETALDLYGDDRLLDTRNLSMAGGESVTVAFTELPSSGVYRVVLNGEDAYAPDNEAYAFPKKAEAANILLLSPGNLFLEKALQLTGSRVTRLDPSSGTGGDRGSAGPPIPDTKPDLIVVDGAAPEFVREGPWAKIWRDTPLWTWGGEGTKKQPENGETETVQHPVTRYVSITEAPTGQLVDAQLPVWAEPIMRIGGRTAAYAGKEAGVPRLVFLFALQDSDLPLRPEFPILVNNAVEWLKSGKATALGRTLAGEKLDIPISADLTEASWVPAGGYALRAGAGPIAADRKKSGEGEGVSSRQTAPGVPGLWKFTGKGADGSEQPVFLAEVVADPAESDFSGNMTLRIGDKNDMGAERSGNEQVTDQQETTPATSTNGGAEGKSRYSLVGLAALLALIVILTEWGVYQRGRSI